MRLTKEQKENLRQRNERFQNEIIDGYKIALEKAKETTALCFDYIRQLEQIAVRATYNFNLREGIATSIQGRNNLVEVSLRAKRQMGCLLKK